MIAGHTVDVQVWWADVREFTLPLQGVPGWELERVSRFRDPLDRARSLLGYTLACAATGADTANPAGDPLIRRCPFCGSARHGPLRGRPGTDVSVAHAGTIVIVAMTRAGRIGVDVEDDPEVLNTDGGTGRRGTSLVPWVEYEALTKATWAGLTVPRSRVQVDAHGTWEPSAETRLLLPRPPAASVTVTSARLGGGQHVALAALDGTPRWTLEPASQLTLFPGAASHRGGRPSFLQVHGSHPEVPDYADNTSGTS